MGNDNVDSSENEIRYDPIKGQKIIVAAHRSKRPVRPSSFCPFCPGAPDVPSGKWDVISIPNRYPALSPDANTEVHLASSNPLFKRTQAYGICEVVVYTPDHNTELEDLPFEHMLKVIELWQNRYRELSKKKGIRYVFIFENRGRAIGVTLDHPHGQIYAFPFIPEIIETELKNSKQYYLENHGRCIFCDTINAEKAEYSRIVYENDNFIAFIPFWAMFPYEVYLLPKRHMQNILELNREEVMDFAKAIRVIRKKYNKYFGFKLPFMMYFHQAPIGNEEYPYYHFHVEFRPIHRGKNKIKYPASVENGAGTFINPTNPEINAKNLRETIVE
ncbi:MAG: galactose-1-phosphate uridylyltransferase [Candidatus Asgardarchaeia archaeon]